jgi:hypothetical protein
MELCSTYRYRSPMPRDKLDISSRMVSALDFPGHAHPFMVLRQPSGKRTGTACHKSSSKDGLRARQVYRIDTVLQVPVPPQTCTYLNIDTVALPYLLTDSAVFVTI